MAMLFYATLHTCTMYCFQFLFNRPSFMDLFFRHLPSLLWCCWFSIRKSIQLVSNLSDDSWGAGIVICLEQGTNDLHIVQLMLLPPHHSSLASLKSGLILSFSEPHSSCSTYCGSQWFRPTQCDLWHKTIVVFSFVGALLLDSTVLIDTAYQKQQVTVHFNLSELTMHCGTGVIAATAVPPRVWGDRGVRPGHWLYLVPCVSFGGLTLMVGRQQGHLAHKIPCSTNPMGSVLEKVEKVDSVGNWHT